MSPRKKRAPPGKGPKREAVILVIAASARISPLANIEDSVRGTRIVIGEDVVIDAFVKLKPVGGMGDIVIGDGTYLNSGTVIYSGNGVTLGKHVLIAANTTIVGSEHQYRSKDTLIKHQGLAPSRGGVLIEDDVWIGSNAVILEGSILHTGCVVGAGSVVRSELAPYSVNAGNPVRQLGIRG